MKQDEIKNKKFEVTILNRGVERDTLCFNLYNEELGEFVVDNCHYNSDPDSDPNAKYCINGNVELKIDEELSSFLTILNICKDDTTKGSVILRC